MSINRVYVENIAQLIELVKEDKLTQNASTYLRDRYPIRFVLFDNFNDSFEFVSQLMDCGCILKSVEDWVDPDYPDIMLTYNDLSRRIKNFIQNETLPSNDYVIAPFSELARFYDNNERKTFESLLRTIKGIESTSEAWNNHQRIYIPIVGLEGKMQSILPDTQIIIWQLKSDKQSNYNLILCHELYGVKGLEKNYTLINNVHDWLQYWKNSVSKEHKSIISISEAIMANAEYAQPDNAFEYKICTDIYCFLTRGLNLDFGELKYSANDEYLWRRLAEDIDLSKDFDLNEFVFEQFSVTSIDDYKTFIKIWFEYPSEYDRWLLSGFYRTSHEDYISKILSKLDNYKDTELVHLIALERSSIENEIIARKYCLDFSYSKNVRLTVEVENLIANQLCALGIQQGYETAVRYFTRISRKERQLAIEWIGKGYIKPSMIQHCFPELYTYLDKSIGTRKESQKWCLPYIDEYKKAKISNTISDELSALINEINNDEISFSNWYNDFKTTRTILQGRDDIDVYYWIDGLGIDWMPYISDSGSIYSKAILKTKYEDQYQEGLTTFSYSLDALFNTFTSSPIGGEFNQKSDISKTEFIRGNYNDLSEYALIYSLYRYAEITGQYTFRVSDLYDNTIQNGIVKEFGIDRQSLVKLLRTLNSSSNRLLVAELNMGLEHITLKEDITAFEALKMTVNY